MPESGIIRRLTKPKVAVPLCASVALIVVAILFGVYCIRNPTFASDMLSTMSSTPSNDAAAVPGDLSQSSNISRDGHSTAVIVTSKNSTVNGSIATAKSVASDNRSGPV
ncbi:unnamed protein product [Anisakis simplex]|uniref:Multidrug resistance efflux pump n=1 Tax=Anisakis simplex TaxID=6269 RepID=A0A0M3JWX1_ANISI|nr:unnamed protein product [Anisakis simplex]